MDRKQIGTLAETALPWTLRGYYAIISRLERVSLMMHLHMRLIRQSISLQLLSDGTHACSMGCRRSAFVLPDFVVLFVCRLCEALYAGTKSKMRWRLSGASMVMREISTQEVVWPLVLPDTRDKERFIHLWCGSALQGDCVLGFHSGAIVHLKVVTDKRGAEDGKKKQRIPI